MESVLAELRDDGTLVVTLNRPDRLNAITEEMRWKFATVLRDAATNTAVAAVIITGAGRGFCAGADLKAGSSTAGERATRESEMNSFHAQFAGALHAFPKPTVALINGPAAGGGLGLALAADIRIASENALFVTAFASLGLPGDNGVTHALVRAAGEARAKELLLLSPRVSAANALRWGLVTEVVPAEDLVRRGAEIADQLAQLPPLVVQRVRENVSLASTATYEQMLQVEARSTAEFNGTKAESS